MRFSCDTARESTGVVVLGAGGGLSGGWVAAFAERAETALPFQSRVRQGRPRSPWPLPHVRAQARPTARQPPAPRTPTQPPRAVSQPAVELQAMTKPSLRLAAWVRALGSVGRACSSPNMWSAAGGGATFGEGMTRPTQTTGLELMLQIRKRVSAGTLRSSASSAGSPAVSSCPMRRR